MKRMLPLLLAFFALQLPAQNVMISDRHKPNEPSIMMDPNNTEVLVAGTNINNFHYSHDGGMTWNSEVLTSSMGVWGDPVIDVDEQGNFYFFHLSNRRGQENWLDRIVCQKSQDRGQSWSDGSYTGLSGTKDHDKHWSVIDPMTNNIYLVWTRMDKVFSKDPEDESLIMFSKSTDGGLHWTEAKPISAFPGDCLDKGETVTGAVPAVGPDGELYVTWVGPRGLMFQRSDDQGETWMEEEQVILPTPANGWLFKIPGIYRNYALPVIKCDLSRGRDRGTIYISWFDQRNGNDDTDVWLIRSDDQGDSWSDLIRVNDDGPGKQQFMSWMDIDQTNGNLHFVFYDRRAYDSPLTDVYTAFSLDGGRSIVNRKMSEEPFYPNRGVFFGDYINITAHNNIVRPIWTRLHEGKLSIWTDVSPFDYRAVAQIPLVARHNPGSEIRHYPNPVNRGKSYVSFKLHESSLVDLDIFNAYGRMVYKAVDGQDYLYGKHIIPIDLGKLGLKPGFYYYKLSINGEQKTMRILVTP